MPALLTWLNSQKWWRPVSFGVAAALYVVSLVAPPGGKLSHVASEGLKVAAVLGVGSFGLSNSGMKKDGA